jgi:hypothetical protein
MKKSFLLWLPAVLFLSVTMGYSQKQFIPGSLETISSNEKSAYSALTVKHSSGLVNNYDLKYHRFRWLVDPSQASIRGSVTSYFVSNAAIMSSIQFELAPEMSADSVFFHNFKIGVNHVGNLITINFGEIIPQGSLDSLTVFYHGEPPSNNGLGSFVLGTHNEVPVLWTLSEPYGASDWWPSKNDLNDKIDSIDVFVAVPNGNVVASNGLLQGVAPYGVNHTAFHWKHRYPIASYLIAIAVTNYFHYTEHITGSNFSFPVENYVYPEDSASCRFRTNELIPVYGLYSSLFGNYPFEREKYGNAEFGWGGGMEHQSMTFIGQTAFNLDVLSHELSHQWFGDMITCGSWHDIWLNEGFATYCAGLMYENLSPNLYWPIWKRNEITFTTSLPGGSVYCDDTTNVDRIFSSRLSYSKGALVLHQLRWILGDSAFFTGIRSYVEDPALRFGFALTHDFINHMEVATGKDLANYFSDWIYNQGFPSYSLSCSQDNPDDLAVTINQAQSDPSVTFFKLPLPVQLFGENRDTTVVFDNTEQGQVFHINPGFMVDSVHFDPENWLITANNHVAMGENDLPAGKMLSIRPNPAKDFLNVVHNLGIFTDVQVLDLSGKALSVIIKENSPGRLIININRLLPGTYILTLRKSNLKVHRKFMISR